MKFTAHFVPVVTTGLFMAALAAPASASALSNHAGGAQSSAVRSAAVVTGSGLTADEGAKQAKQAKKTKKAKKCKRAKKRRGAGGCTFTAEAQAARRVVLVR